MRRFVAVVCAVALPATAFAQVPAKDSISGDTTTTATGGSAVDVSTRPAPGEIVSSSRIVSSADLGLWARAPSGFGGSVVVAGGDIGLASWLTLRLYGADDFIFHRFSGMLVGAEAWLLPRSSPLQLSVAGGFLQSTTPGGAALWTQATASASFGLFRLGAALRAQTNIGDPTSAPQLTTTAFVTYGKAVKLGLAYVDESASGAAPARRAIVPSITASTKGGAVDFGASSSISVGGAPMVPVMLRVGGKF